MIVFMIIHKQRAYYKWYWTHAFNYDKIYITITFLIVHEFTFVILFVVISFVFHWLSILNYYVKKNNMWNFNDYCINWRRRQVVWTQVKKTFYQVKLFFSTRICLSISIDFKSREIKSNRNFNDSISWQSIRFDLQSEIGIESNDLIWISNRFET
jgi:hypothetical protein